MIIHIYIVINDEEKKQKNNMFYHSIQTKTTEIVCHISNIIYVLLHILIIYFFTENINK